MGDAISRVAGGIANLADAALTKQRNLLEQAELTKQLSQLDSDMAVESARIKQENISSPDEAIKILDEKRKELFGAYKNSITDPEVKIRFDALGSESLVKGQALDRLWAFQKNNELIQQRNFDRITNDAAFAGQTDSFAEVLEKAYRLDQDREEIYQAWGSVKEGSKVIDQGQESIVKSYFYSQLSKGNAFKVLKEIDSGEFGPTEGSNGLIDVQKLKEMKNIAKRMVLVGKDDAGALALMDAVQTNFDIDAALDAPIATTEEKINSLSFEIAKKKAGVQEGHVGEEEVAVLEQQQQLLENVRAAQLSRNKMFIQPDEDLQAEMTARFFNLFKKGEGNFQKPFKATIEEVFKFQQDLVKNRDRLDPAFVKRHAGIVQSSFESEIQGFKKGSRLSTKASWFGLGPLVAQDPGKLSGSKKLQNVFADIIEKHDPADGNKFLFETMQIFMDDLDERLDIKNTTDLQMLPQTELEGLMDGAKRKMQLKKAGLPIYLGEKDIVYRNNAAYRIVGFDDDGMPLVEAAE